MPVHIYIYFFPKDTKRFSTHALLTKTVWEPGSSYNTVSNKVLLTKRLSTQALLTKRYRSQAQVTEKTLWPSLATKLYVQTGVAPMLFVQNVWQLGSSYNIVILSKQVLLTTTTRLNSQALLTKRSGNHFSHYFSSSIPLLFCLRPAGTDPRTRLQIYFEKVNA